MDYLTYLRSINYRSQDYSPMYYAPMEQNMNVTEQMPWPLDFQNKSSQYILSKAIAGVKESVADERHDELFYDFLMSKAPNNEQKEIIASIRDDERIHNKIFRKIFTELSGVVMPSNAENNMEKTDNYSNTSYLDGLKMALMGELAAVRKYREFAAYMPTKDLFNMVMYPLTDEIRHATLYNYLIALNMNS